MAFPALRPSRLYLRIGQELPIALTEQVPSPKNEIAHMKCKAGKGKSTGEVLPLERDSKRLYSH